MNVHVVIHEQPISMSDTNTLKVYKLAARLLFIGYEYFVHAASIGLKNVDALADGLFVGFGFVLSMGAPMAKSSFQKVWLRYLMTSCSKLTLYF